MSEVHICIVTGEESGDALGAAIIDALIERTPAGMTLRLTGVGADRLASRGLATRFPLEDIAVMGISAVIGRLPIILRRMRDMVDHIIRTQPDLLLLIDSPDFTHRVAKRVRARGARIPTVKVVSPSVWAWRPGRARDMARYVDLLLAVLPFEPAVHARLGGPPTTYIGHPLIEALPDLRPREEERSLDGPILLLPGSRQSEITRHLDLFHDVARALLAKDSTLDFAIPTVPHLADEVARQVETWRMPVSLIRPEGKYAAMRTARAALAASGTVTLELALAGVPMVVAYKLDPIVARLRWLGSVPSIVLPNLIIERNAFPEFVHEDATPAALTSAMDTILQDGPARNAQLMASDKVIARMRADDLKPSEAAAQAILALLTKAP